MMTHSTNNKQCGFSLFELLITMLIGLFLLVGISTSFIATKKASVSRDQLSVIEENGSFALEIISGAIEHAGFTPRSGVNTLEKNIITDLTDITPETCRSGGGNTNIINQNLFDSNTVTQDNTNGDSITIVQYGDQDIDTDCSGNILPSSCRPSKIYNAFFINTHDELVCAGSRSGRLETIASGIENIQFLYGIRNENNSSIQRYVNATNINDQWEDVVSIQVGILVRSKMPMKQNAEQKIYSLLDQKVTSPNDRYQRAVFTTTIRLRNVL